MNQPTITADVHGDRYAAVCVAAGHKVAWFSLEALGILVRRHRADDSVTRSARSQESNA